MDEENELVALRRSKLDALRAQGVEPFGATFEPDGSIAEVREKFTEGEIIRAAGRITAHRDMGKSHFLDLRDATGRIQIYIHAKEVGADLIDLFRLLDIGDFIGVEGTYFLTKSGEPTLKVRTFRLLAKALRPLPEKWHGLQDVEARYRQRSLDLLTNERSRAVFEKRIAIVRETRRFFDERGFLEVETPILQTIAGGAAAEPFSTHHKALGLDLYLRIAPELYLKRLLVGGFNKVFQVKCNFRNEGISRKQNADIACAIRFQTEIPIVVEMRRIDIATLSICDALPNSTRAAGKTECSRQHARRCFCTDHQRCGNRAGLHRVNLPGCLQSAPA